MWMKRDIRFSNIEKKKFKYLVQKYKTLDSEQKQRQCNVGGIKWSMVQLINQLNILLYLHTNKNVLISVILFFLFNIIYYHVTVFLFSATVMSWNFKQYVYFISNILWKLKVGTYDNRKNMTYKNVLAYNIFHVLFSL